MASTPVLGQAPIVAHPEPAGKTDSGVVVADVMKQYELMKLKASGEPGEKSFIWPEGMRPSTRHDQYDFELPVIDLSAVLKLQSLRREIEQLEPTDAGARSRLDADIKACEAAKLDVAKAIRAACEEYGFFQIINTGFPTEVVDQFTEKCRQVFDLPLEKKMKIGQHLNGQFGTPAYTPMARTNPITRMNPAYIWQEGLTLESPEIAWPGRTEQMANILWQGEPESYMKGHLLRSTIEEYGKHSSRLTFLLVDLIVRSLEIPEETVTSLLGDRQVTARIRVNNYPVCEHPELTWGIHGHTDPYLITLLHQDSVGGLQVRFKDGTWHGLQPKPGAFVMNCGDYLQAWTNGRFLSAEHRVVTNEKCDRFSVAYLAYSDANYVISPRPECVDAEHPIRYKPFTKGEFIQAYVSLGVGRDRGELLDRAFGIQT